MLSGPLPHPVAHGGEVLLVNGRLAGLPITTLDIDGVVRAHDHAGLVDPEHGGDVPRVVELRHHVLLIDQRGMGGIRRVDEWLRSFAPRGLAGDGDDLEALVLQLLAQVLPDRQVQAAPSPGRPGDEEDFLAALLREAVPAAAEIGQLEVGGLQLEQGCSQLLHGRAEVPRAVGVVVRDRLIEVAGEAGEVDLLRVAVATQQPGLFPGDGDAELVAADAFRLELPARGGRKVGGCDPEVVAIRLGLVRHRRASTSNARGPSK